MGNKQKTGAKERRRGKRIRYARTKNTKKREARGVVDVVDAEC
jgi:hypothetical protein